jgi:acetyl esterase/lipase
LFSGPDTGSTSETTRTETAAGEVPALWAAPKNCAEDRVLLCAHGGGYVASRASPVCERIVKAPATGTLERGVRRFRYLSHN